MFPNFYTWIIQRFKLDPYTARYIDFTPEQMKNLDLSWFKFIYELEKFKYTLRKALRL